MNNLWQLEFRGNLLPCYPLCLRYSNVQSLRVGSTPICEQGVPTNISPLERQALQDLYDSTDGPHWNYFCGISWDFSDPNANPCDEEWYGITCSVDYHVTSLYLVDNNLKGTIPQSISQLSSLQGLGLSYNQLIGTIVRC